LGASRGIRSMLTPSAALAADDDGQPSGSTRNGCVVPCVELIESIVEMCAGVSRAESRRLDQSPDATASGLYSRWNFFVDKKHPV
jgi:hypothetical protein